MAGALLAPPSGANLRTYNLALVATAEFRNTMGTALATTNQFNNYITRSTRCTRPSWRSASPSPAPRSATRTPRPTPSPIRNGGRALLDEADATLDADCGNLPDRPPDPSPRRRRQLVLGPGRDSIVCQGAAGRAASTGTNVNSGLWVVDLLPHEMGHQFSAATRTTARPAAASSARRATPTRSARARRSCRTPAPAAPARTPTATAAPTPTSTPTASTRSRTTARPAATAAPRPRPATRRPASTRGPTARSRAARRSR